MRIILYFIIVIPLIQSCRDDFKGTWLHSTPADFKIITYIGNNRLIYTKAIHRDSLDYQSDTLEYKRRFNKIILNDSESVKQVFVYNAKDKVISQESSYLKFILLKENPKALSVKFQDTFHGKWNAKHLNTNSEIQIYCLPKSKLVWVYGEDLNNPYLQRDSWKVIDQNDHSYLIIHGFGYTIRLIDSITTDTIKLIYSLNDSLFTELFIRSHEVHNNPKLIDNLVQTWKLNTVNDSLVDSMELIMEPPCENFIKNDIITFNKDHSYKLSKHCYEVKGFWEITSDGKLLILDSGDRRENLWYIKHLDSLKLNTRSLYKPLEGRRQFFNLEFTAIQTQQ